MQIYQILNKLTGKSYIGKSKNFQERFEKHKKNSITKTNRLYSSMRHHGVENFQLVLLEDLGDVSLKEVNSRETFWIKHFQSNDPKFGYNMTEGGDGGYTLASWDSESRAALYRQQSNARKGRLVSEETRKKIGDGHRGKIIPDEMRRRISETNKEKGIRPPIYTKEQGNTGFKGPHSEKTRKKLSEARKGKSYEKLFGVAQANSIKEHKKEIMSGRNNHQFKEITEQDFTHIKQYLTTNKIKLYELAEKVGFSKYKLRQVMATFGIMNYQKLYQELDNQQWILFWKEKYANENL